MQGKKIVTWNCAEFITRSIVQESKDVSRIVAECRWYELVWGYKVGK